MWREIGVPESTCGPFALLRKNRLEIRRQRATGCSSADRVPAIDTWPFPNIPLVAFTALTADDRRILEALTQTYLLHAAQSRQLAPAPRDCPEFDFRSYPANSAFHHSGTRIPRWICRLFFANQVQEPLQQLRSVRFQFLCSTGRMARICAIEVWNK